MYNSFAREEITIFMVLLLSVDDIVKKATKYFLACPKIHKQNLSFLCDGSDDGDVGSTL
jgi:hypothetical protein